MSEAAEYQQAIIDLNETFRAGIRAFAAWFAADFQTSPAQWRHAYSDPRPTDEWFTGYNAGVESVMTAADLFLDEFHQ